MHALVDQVRPSLSEVLVSVWRDVLHVCVCVSVCVCVRVCVRCLGSPAFGWASFVYGVSVCVCVCVHVCVSC